MTQYLLSVHNDPSVETPSTEAMQEMFAAVDRFNEEVQASGAWVFAGGLAPADTATVVRTAGGNVTTTAGPYAETKTYIGGFWVVEVADLDAALALAAKGSTACQGAVEVRPFQEEPPSE